MLQVCYPVRASRSQRDVAQLTYVCTLREYTHVSKNDRKYQSPFSNLPCTHTERYTDRFLLALFVSVSVAALYLSPPRFGTSTGPRTLESSPAPQLIRIS